MHDRVLAFNFKNRDYEIRAATNKPALCVYDLLDVVARVQHTEPNKRSKIARDIWTRLTHGNTPAARELLALAFDAPVRKCARVRDWNDLPCLSYAGTLKLLDAVERYLSDHGLVEGAAKVAAALAARPAAPSHADDERRAAAFEERALLTRADQSQVKARLQQAHFKHNANHVKTNAQERLDIAAELADATAEAVLSSAAVSALDAYALHRRRVADKGRGRDATNTASVTPAAPKIDYNAMVAERYRALAPTAPKIDYNAMVAERYRALAAAGDDPALLAAFHAQYPAAPVQKTAGPRNINHDLIEHVRGLLRSLDAGDTSALTHIETGPESEPLQKKQKTEPTLAPNDLVLHLPRGTVVFGAKHTFEKKNLQTNTSTTESVQVFSILAFIKLNSDLACTPFCYNYARDLWKRILKQKIVPDSEIFPVSIKRNAKSNLRDTTPSTTISNLLQIWYLVKNDDDIRSSVFGYQGKPHSRKFEPMDQNIYTEFITVLRAATQGDESMIEVT
jgi:hypothetical protein